VCSTGVCPARPTWISSAHCPAGFETRSSFWTGPWPSCRVLIDKLLDARDASRRVTKAMKWSDVLRIKAEIFPHQPVAECRAGLPPLGSDLHQDNVPYDHECMADAHVQGSNFRVPPVNFYRAMQNMSRRHRPNSGVDVHGHAG